MSHPDLDQWAPSSTDPIDWDYHGHRINQDSGEYNAPGVGIKRDIVCSCGVEFRSRRWADPTSALYELWDQYRDHVRFVEENLG